MKRLFTTFLLLCVAMFAFAKSTVSPVSLVCNDRENPLAVSDIRFSWKLAGTATGAKQTAYEIWIGTTPSCNGNVWKSGKTVSEDQLDIVPAVKSDLKEGKAYYWKVRVWDEADKASAWSGVASFSVGIDNSWESDWIATGKTGDGPFPYFRKTFDLQKGKVSRAVVYLSGLGCSELFFNGTEVDPTRVLDPAQTDYQIRALYSAFDVTGLLANGKNCIGVMLGAGWYNQDKVWSPGMSYGKPILRCQIVIEYSNGKTETVGTDTSWKWADGPIVKSNVYQGDEYDATKAIEGWCSASFDDSAWNSAVKADGVVPQYMQAQELPPMRTLEPIVAQKMWRSPKGGNVWVYDFGCNLTSEILFSAKLPRGVRLQTRGAEEVKPNGDMDYKSTGIEHVGYQQDAYTFAGKDTKETWMPHFTYHGMRYVELTVEGTDQEPAIDWIRMVPVHTAVTTIADFKCADDQLNALHDLATRTFLNAFVGLPVDCNQREKCGWLGDTHAYDRAADMNFQMNNFWLKYLEDIRTTAAAPLENTLHHKLYNNFFYFKDKPAGVPHMIAPGRRLCGVASPDWGTAVVQIPWHLYTYYGNKQILEDYYDMMKIWVHEVAVRATDGIVYEGLSDWCPMYSSHAHNNTPVEVTSTEFHLIDLGIMIKTAKILGKDEDLKWYEQQNEYVRKAFIAKFFNPWKCTFGGQTGDAMALELGLFPEDRRQEGAEAIIFDIKQGTHGFFDIGVFGLPRIGSQLSRNGAAQSAYSLFTKKGENSFGYMIDSLHVHTLWESLPMNSRASRSGGGSHNHPMQGGYDSWILEDVAGIRPCEVNPGFKTIIFDPLHTDLLEWAELSIDTRYGKTSTSWNSKYGKLTWKIQIPAGANGLVRLPEDKNITVNGAPLTYDQKEIDGKSYYQFPSGSFDIVAE